MVGSRLVLVWVVESCVWRGIELVWGGIGLVCEGLVWVSRGRVRETQKGWYVIVIVRKGKMARIRY